jgi:hypothetical protein
LNEPKPDMTEAPCPGPVRCAPRFFSFSAFIAITLLAAPLALMALMLQTTPIIYTTLSLHMATSAIMAEGRLV